LDFRTESEEKYIFLQRVFLTLTKMVLPQIDSFKREPTSSPSGDQSIHSDDTTTIMWSANEFEPTNYDPQYSFVSFRYFD
jgi:hypothetical protein